ncbi:spermidine synthase [Sphingoaurantiacus capsulatus]|uniref:Spermidine synthase n=1 Tax=Sphingoaurantiacus capsulatus TaxID=1771310 RepID=A0ABV7X7C3_9SPHN
MKIRELLDTIEIPDGSELKLYRRDGEYSIMLGGTELMNSRKTGSEIALASLACERLKEGPRPSVLIGGLGMGFTLRAALDRLPPEARVDVAELVPGIVAWARGPMADIFGDSLDDRRVHLIVDDVAQVIRDSASTYDAILLDVDNGPDGFTRDSNERLYDARGLGSLRGALRPGGVLTVWSSAGDRVFTARLKRAGFEAEEVVVRSGGGKGGARHIVWVAKRS